MRILASITRGAVRKKMIVLKQISVKSTDMIITIFPVWSSIINALLRTQINVNFCVVKPSKVHFIAVYSYMGLYSMIYSIVQHCPTLSSIVKVRVYPI